MSVRCPVAAWTPLKATSCVPASTARRRLRLPARRCGRGPDGRRTPCRPAAARGSGWSCTPARPMTTFSPRAAGPNWAATSPAADETEGISATSRAVGADQPSPPPIVPSSAACSPRLKSKPSAVQSSIELVVGVREPAAGETDRGGVEVGPIRGRREQATSLVDVRGPGRRCRVGHDLQRTRGGREPGRSSASSTGARAAPAVAWRHGSRPRLQDVLHARSSPTWSAPCGSTRTRSAASWRSAHRSGVRSTSPGPRWRCTRAAAVRIRPTGLGFEVDDIDSAVSAVVAAGGRVIGEPRERPQERIRLAEVADSEGNRITVAQTLS